MPAADTTTAISEEARLCDALCGLMKDAVATIACLTRAHDLSVLAHEQESNTLREKLARLTSQRDEEMRERTVAINERNTARQECMALTRERDEARKDADNLRDACHEWAEAECRARDKAKRLRNVRWEVRSEVRYTPTHAWESCIEKLSYRWEALTCARTLCSYDGRIIYRGVHIVRISTYAKPKTNR